MSLNEDQFEFMKDVGLLICWVYTHPNWALTGGELYRPQQMADIYAKQGIGIKNSKHIKRLAIDLMFFINGVYLTESDDYEPLGEYWESLSDQNEWGGVWASGDADHFERKLISELPA